MKYLLWLLKAAIFYPLCLRTEQSARRHGAFFFGTQWDGAGRADRAVGICAQGWSWAFWAWCRAGGATAAPHARPRPKPPTQRRPAPPAPRQSPYPTSCPSMEFDFTWLLLDCRWPLAWAGWPRAWICASCARKTGAHPRHISRAELPAQRAAGSGHRRLYRGRTERPGHHRAALCAGQPVSPPRRIQPRRARARAPALAWRPLARRPRACQHALALDFLKAGLLDRAEDAAPPGGHALRGPGAHGAAGHLRTFARLAAGVRHHTAHARRRSGRFQYAPGPSPVRTGPGAQRPGANCLPPRPCCCRLQANPRRHARASSWRACSNAWARPTQPCQRCKTLAQTTPAALGLAAPLLVEAALASGQAEQAGAPAAPALRGHADPGSAFEAVVTLEAATQGSATCRSRMVYAPPGQEPSLVAASKWLAGETLSQEQFHLQIQRALEQATAAHALPLRRLRLRGAPAFLAMPGCQSWDSYPARRVEEGCREPPCACATACVLPPCCTWAPRWPARTSTRRARPIWTASRDWARR